jgi:hypothetical protein
MKSPTSIENSIVLGAKFTGITIFGVRMAAQVGQLGSAPGQQPSMEESRISLTKIRKVCYIFLLSESASRSPLDGRENEKPWLFETLAYNPPREPGRGKRFS